MIYTNKNLLTGLLISILSVSYVLQVNAAEKTSLLDKKEPIRIESGFTTPFSVEKPLRILVSDVNIDIPIVSAAVIDGHWEVSETLANHGQGTATPGQNGNMVIFAHARPGLFLDLQKITYGSEIIIYTDKKWYAYTVVEILQVTPDQVEVIAPTADERVTLFTCSGFSDEKRFIVVGKRNTETNFGVDSTLMDLLE